MVVPKHHEAVISYVDEQKCHVSTATLFQESFFIWEDTIEEPYLAVAAKFTFFSSWKLDKVLGGTVYLIKEVLESAISR